MNRDELPKMQAAGGLVLCGGKALLIRKHLRWDIPKGKVKKRERSEICALREISEETGLDQNLLSVRQPLCSSSYISYYSYGPVNKTVDWFILDYAGAVSDPLAPDISEDIDMCRWVPFDDLLEVMETARNYLEPVKPHIADYLSAAPVASESLT